MQEPISTLEAAFQPLITLLDENLAEVDEYPEVLRALFSIYDRAAQVLVLETGRLSKWFTLATEAPLDFEEELEQPEELRLFNRETGEWTYRWLFGLVQLDYDYCAVLLDVENGSLTLSVYTAQEAPSSHFPLKQGASVLSFAECEPARCLSLNMTAWLNALTGQSCVPTSSMLQKFHAVDPLLELLGDRLHSFGILRELNLSGNRSEVVLAMQHWLDENMANEESPEDDSLPHRRWNEAAVRIQLDRPLPLEETSVTKQGRAYIVSSETKFIIPQAARKLVAHYLKTNSRTTSVAAVALTTYLCREPMTAVEIAMLAIELGIPTAADRVPASATTKVRVTKVEQAFRVAFSQCGFSHRPRSAGECKVNEEKITRTVSPPCYVASLVKDQVGGLFTLYQCTAFGLEQTRVQLNGDTQVLSLQDSGSENRHLIYFCHLVEQYGPINYGQLRRLWLNHPAAEYEPDCFTESKLILATRLTVSRGWISSKNDPRIRQHVYTSRPDALTLLPLPNYPERELMAVELQKLFEGEDNRMASFSECLVYITDLQVQGSKSNLLRHILQGLVKDRKLYFLQHPENENSDCYVLRGSEFDDRMSFEHFYASLNATFMRNDPQADSLAFNRIEAFYAYKTGNVYGNQLLLRSHELTIPVGQVNSYVEVRANTGPLAKLGNGLFACTDLPEGFSLPVQGKLLDNANLPKQMKLDYGFKFRSCEVRHCRRKDRMAKLVIDCRPEPDGPVTCWAGYVNDCRGTEFGPNAVCVVSVHEDRLYLKLSEPVAAGQQLFWSYGSKYWQKGIVQDSTVNASTLAAPTTDLTSIPNVLETGAAAGQSEFYYWPASGDEPQHLIDGLKNMASLFGF